jgi:hypothetical protein
MDPPRLIENSVRNYMFQTLQKCHSNRTTIYYYALNVGVLVSFIGLVGLVLYNAYKNKLSPYEQHEKMIRDQEYVLSKIRWFQEDRKIAHESEISPITHLPVLQPR